MGASLCPSEKLGWGVLAIAPQRSYARAKTMKTTADLTIVVALLTLGIAGALALLGCCGFQSAKAMTSTRWRPVLAELCVWVTRR